MCVADGRVFLIGGWDGANRLSEVWELVIAKHADIRLSDVTSEKDLEVCYNLLPITNTALGFSPGKEA